ncbi:MAG: aspartate-semialdehyde dehydrogenase [Anaeroplasmataceae bacterium]|nr:aspartate-semialdehyde dehydrogenase [Anaeroplasmataceae bacterium]
MKKYAIGILGATGAVGREMLKILEEYNFPISELRLLASKRSVGKTICFHGNPYPVLEATKKSFEGLDFVLGAASNPVALEFAQSIVEANAVFIDNSSAFRMVDSVPLVVPEINGEDAFSHHGIIANPNCSTIIALMAVHAIHKKATIETMAVATYQATSGAGAAGPIELKEQMEAVCENRVVEASVFQYPIIENVIPHIGSFLDNGYTTEEMKMQNEGRKILHHPDFKVSCTCVRVPVVRSHSISIELITKNHMGIEEIRNTILSEKGLRLYDSPKERLYPMPLVTSNQDLVYVGRIRQSVLHDNGISLWCCGDQIRKGAATNAVQIMMKLIGLKY